MEEELITINGKKIWIQIKNEAIILKTINITRIYLGKMKRINIVINNSKGGDYIVKRVGEIKELEVEMKTQLLQFNLERSSCLVPI